MKKIIAIFCILLILSTSYASAQSTRNNDIPVFTNTIEETGESIIVNVGKLEPTIVPTNILEEQNVPVYVYLKGATLGSLAFGEDAPENFPFYGIPEIERVSISNVESTNNLVSRVVHVKPRDRRYVVEKGERFFDMGYLILELRKIKDEKELPQFNDTALARIKDDNLELLRTGGPTIDAKISMDIRFNTENSFGAFGAQDLRLTEQINEKEWIDGAEKTSFWRRNGYIRAYRIRDDGVSLSVYDGRNRRIHGATLNKNGDESSPIRLKEFGPIENSLFRIRLNNVVVPKDSAEFSINGDIYNLIEGQRLYPGSNWKVEKIRKDIEIKNDDNKVTAQYDEVTLVGKEGQRKSLKIVKFGELDVKTGKVVPQKDVTKVDRTTAGYNKFKNILDNDPEFIIEVEKVASRLNINPDHLMAVMALESEFDPSVENPSPDSEATGLIQFLPSIADSLGTSISSLKAMTRTSQLEFVEKYFNQYKSRIRKDNLEDVYMTVLYPEAIGKSDTTKILYRIYEKNGKIINEYNANKGLDVNKDGEISVREAVVKVTEKYPLTSTGTSQTNTVESQQSISLQDDDICINVNFEDSEALDKTSNQLYCKSIQEIEEAINKGLTGETLNEAYYRLGEANGVLGKDNLYYKREAILAFENIKSGNLYDAAQEKKINLEAEVAGKINTAGATVFLEDENIDITFRSIKSVKEKDKASATLSIDNNQKVYNVGEVVAKGSDEQNKNFNWIIESISSDKIVLRQSFEQSEISGRRETVRINEVVSLQTEKDKSVTIQILDIDTKRQAYITILPGSGKAISRSVVDVKIPIERRAIQFNTEQIDWQINKTRDVIKKLDSIIDKLDTTVKVWKGTCLTVFAFISAKNLLKPSIEGEARNLVMRGIDGKSGFSAYCNQNSGLGKAYSNYDECIFKNQAYIEKRISEEKTNVESANDYLKNGYPSQYGDYRYDDSSDPLVSRSEAKEFELLRLQLAKSKENLDKLPAGSIERGLEQENYNKLDERYKLKQETISELNKDITNAKTFAGKVSDSSLRKEAFSVKLNELSLNEKTTVSVEDIPGIRKVVFANGMALDDDGNVVETREVFGSEYSTTLKEIAKKETDENKKKRLSALLSKIEKEPNKLVVTEGGYTIYKDNSGNYYYVAGEDYLGLRIRRTYARPNIAEYYENGRPFCVPTGEGNYARVLEYYADGTAKTVDERNVGTNGVMCDEDDVIINSDSLVKLNPQKEQELKRAAARAGTCSPGTYKVGSFVCSHARAKAAQAVTKLHCTDTMSISDCKVLFNVCDPVMCPTSRFNLGGKWNVNSVPETGIIGSVVLGQNTDNNPLSKICYSGVLSGLEGIRSVFQGYEQCLQTSKVDGTTVGICDKVKSVFICENVWRETVAITGSVGGFSAFSGKLFGNVDGGGEYAPNEFGKRLKQTSDSAKFFANDYATSSLASYEARSLGEVGSQICRNIYAGKAPGIGKLIDQITTPESPPQFTAFFDEYPWSSDAGDTRLNVGAGLFSNVQEQSRYSVFYHIYAGRATDVKYSVYLKDRLGNVAYVTERAGGRSRGFIPREEFASKNIDFIGKSGFTEICVEINGRETCGFGRSSTDFANELQKEINTKEQCVPENNAGPTLGGIATPENINTGDVTGGIVRVCSHQNPGEGGNEARWQVVGQCGKDKEKIELGSCWIDVNTIRINDLSKQEQNVQNIINKYDVKDGEVSLGLSKEEFSTLLINNDALVADYGFPSILDKPNKLLDNVKKSFITTIGTEDDKTSLRFIAAQSIDYGAIAQLRIGEIYLALANDKNIIENVAEQNQQQTLQKEKSSGSESGTEVSQGPTYTLEYSGEGINGELHIVFKGLERDYYVKDKPGKDEEERVTDYPIYQRVGDTHTEVGYISLNGVVVTDTSDSSNTLKNLNIDLLTVTNLFENKKGGIFFASSGKPFTGDTVLLNEQKLKSLTGAEKQEGEKVLSKLVSDGKGILKYDPAIFAFRDILYYKYLNGWQWSPDKENWMPVTWITVIGGDDDGKEPPQAHLDIINTLSFVDSTTSSVEASQSLTALSTDSKVESGKNVLSKLVPDENGIFTYKPFGVLATEFPYYKYENGWLLGSDTSNWKPVKTITTEEERLLPSNQRDLIGYLKTDEPTVDTVKDAVRVATLDKLGNPDSNGVYSYSSTSDNLVAGVSPTLYLREISGSWEWSTEKTNWGRTTFVSSGDENKLMQDQVDVINSLSFVQSEQQSGYPQSIFSVGLNGKRIVIDPGHGGDDSGTTYNENGKIIRESDVVLVISKKLKEEFEKNGATVFMTRDSDISLGLFTRKKIANSYNPDLFISIHVNDLKTGCSDGTQTFIFCASNEDSLQDGVTSFVPLGQCTIKNEYYDGSLRAAQEINPLIVNYIGTRNRGVGAADFSVLQDSLGVKIEAPAMLIETGYLCNADDRSKLVDAETQRRLATSIVQGATQFFA
ncbi:N-acetylmuramoyl-L-alanine amidase [Candidatus Woesearchaeota archaeon]|nr:N-acetylmuramoyl-L-alanine amidase [Candidatus Woesearchaeota archaeon]